MKATRAPRDNRPPGHPEPNKLFMTSQIYEQDGSWWMTVRLERLTDDWTSQPIKLDATDVEAAKDEAAIRAARLLAILGGKFPGEE